MNKALKIVLIIVLVLVLLIGGGFAWLYSNGMSGMSSTTEAAEGQIRIACVGDSITYGHGTTGWPANSYPSKLQGLLGDAYHVNNYGVSGHAVQANADMPYRDLPHYQESIAYDADIVVFMMGSNDAKPQNWIDAATFKADLLSLLEVYGETNHHIQPLVVNEIAEIVREVAQEHGYTLIDIHALTAEHPEWFSGDGVHPSNDGAAAIAQTIASVLTE